MEEYTVDETSKETFSEVLTEEVVQDPSEIERGSEALVEASRAIARGEDGTAKFEAIKSDPGYQPKTADDLANENAKRFQQELETEITTSIDLGEKPDPVEIKERVNAFGEASMSVFRGFRDALEIDPNAKNFSPEAKDRLAKRDYLRLMSAKVVGEMGVTDWAADLTSFALPDVENIRMGQVAELVGMEYNAIDALDYSDFVQRLHSRIMELPPEEAISTIDLITEDWEEILGDNRLILGTFLTNLTGDYSHDLESLLAKMGTADQALSAVGVLSAVPKMLIKGTNAINLAVKSGNLKGAAAVAEAGTSGDLVGSGVDVIDAATTVMPGSKLDTLVPGADNSEALAVTKLQKEVQIHLDEVDKVNSYGLALTPEEQKLAVDRKIKALQEEEDLVDIVKVEGGDKGFTVHYTTGDGTGDVHQRSASYLVSDAGTFISDGQSGYKGYDFGVTSLNFRFSDDRKFIVQFPEQMNFQSGKIRASYDNALKSALGGLDKTAYAKVDQLLTSGDEMAKSWTKQDLMSGTTGVKYTEAEADAYLGVRQVVDHMYHAKNKQILESWNAQGIKMVDWNDTPQPMKRYEDSQSALTAFRQANTHSHMVAVKKKDGGFDRYNFDSPLDMDNEWIKQKYAEGYELSRVTNNRFLELGDTKAEWALIRKGEFTDPSGMVLGKREGYMPKIRKDGHFFVKRLTEMNIGGKTVGGIPNTLRYFDNYTDAKKWMERQDDASDLKVFADGEMSSADREMEYVNISGGLFTGARKQTEIPFGLEEDALKAQRQDSLQGLQRYVGHLAKQMPFNLYRMAIRERWEKSARELGALKGSPVGGFDDLVHELDIRHPAYQFLKDAHDQVSLISGVPTDAEKAARASSEALGLWLEKIGLKKAAAKVHGKNISDEVTGAARGAAFHTLLGMYNPAQYLVQASGSLIALSINPVHAMKAIPKSMSYQVLDRMLAKNPQKLDSYLKWMESKGLDTDGYRLWNKSGLRESITSSNLDYAGIWADLPYDAGVVRKIMGNDTFFFKSGELVNARLSFATAYDRWKSLNPDKVPDQSDLQDILARTEQYRLNMSKANSAKFQTGLMSLPTQFQQVNTKFMEKLLGSDLTGAEKTRLAMGQTAFFGTVGFPIVGYTTPLILDMLGLNAENLTEEEMNTVRNGGLAFFFNDFLDINSVITGRMALGGDFVEKLYTAAVEPSTLVDVLAGPSYSIYEKTSNMVFNVNTALSADFSAEGLETNKIAMVTEVLAKSLAQFAPPVANSLKAYDMTHSRFYKNRSGKPIFEWADNNQQTIMFQAFGFSPMEVQDYYEINNRDGGIIPSSMTNMDAKRITYIMNMLADGSEDGANEAALYAINTIKTKYKPEDRAKLMDQVMKQIKDPKEPWERNLKGVIDEWTSELNDGFMDMLRIAKVKTNPRMAREMEKAGVKD